MMCVVMKPFVSNGEDFVRDQLVDGGEFRNVQVLLTQRFLRHATEDEIKSARFEGEDAVEEDEDTDVDDTEDTESDSEDKPARPAKKLKSVAKKVKAVVRKKAKALKARTRRR